MRESQRIAVIGGVAAGTAAAAEAKRVDPKATVVLFEKGPFIAYSACEIPLLLDGTLQHEELIQFDSEKFSEAKGVEVRIQTEVTGIEPKRNRLTARDADSGAIWEERFDKFILATGASAKIPPVPGIEALNVFPVRTLEDGRALRAAVARTTGLHVVVVGGGYVGIEIAESLVSAGQRVSLLAPGGNLLPDNLDPPFQARLAGAVDRGGVTIRDELLSRVVVDPANRVQALETLSGERIGCSIVVLATGIQPDVSLAVAAGAKVGASGAVQVSDTMRTSVSNIWACGDCVEVTRIVDNASVYSPLSPTAYRTARVAAGNAAGKGRYRQRSFAGVCPASGVRVFEMEVASVGLTLGQARKSGLDAVAADIEHWSRGSHHEGANPLAVRYVVERKAGRLLGGQLFGADGAALRGNVLVPLIRRKWSVDEIAELDFIYNPPVSPSLDPLYIAARAAQRLLAE